MPSKKSEPTKPVKATNKPQAEKQSTKKPGNEKKVAGKQAPAKPTNQVASKSTPAASKGAKKEKKATKPTSKGSKKVEVAQPVANRKDPLFPARPRNFRIGNDILPKKRDLTRFVRWPRYIRLQRHKKILLQRLKVPPSLHQFSHTLDKNQATELFNLLLKYRPETKTEKLTRQRKLAAQQEESKDPVNIQKPRPMIKYGLHHITQLIEQKKAKLVAIAHDVQPVELVVWLPALCRKLDVPYCIVKSKSRLGLLIHQKTATAVCLTEVKPSDEHKLEQLASNFKAQYNFNVDSYRKWGGGLMGLKTRVKLEKRKKATEAEAAKQTAIKK
jgi:large subunit ribosomal protein L7Ae